MKTYPWRWIGCATPPRFWITQYAVVRASSSKSGFWSEANEAVQFISREYLTLVATRTVAIRELLKSRISPIDIHVSPVDEPPDDVVAQNFDSRRSADVDIGLVGRETRIVDGERNVGDEGGLVVARIVKVVPGGRVRQTRNARVGDIACDAAVVVVRAARGLRVHAEPIRRGILVQLCPLATSGTSIGGVGGALEVSETVTCSVPRELLSGQSDVIVVPKSRAP